MNFFILSLFYTHVYSSSITPILLSRRSIPLPRLNLRPRDDCQTNPSWQPTQSAWTLDNTDSNLAAWWANISSTNNAGGGVNFANALGKGFGAESTGFECGILDFSSCIQPACSDYANSNSPPWAYQATMAVVNLNTYFNSLYEGITQGQVDYLSLTSSMAETFFPWKDPQFPLADASLWIIAVLAALFAIPGGIAVEAGVAAAGVGAFAAAGMQELTDKLTPVSTLSDGIAKLNTVAEEVGSTSRRSVEAWANTTFSGQQDTLNKTILDYLYNGSFVQGNLPTHAQIEQFYKAQMVSRTINSQWATQKIFVTFHQTSNASTASGPNVTKYYSTADNGVYYMYKFTETGVLKGYLDAPWGLSELNGSDYGISGTDITKASARAWRQGGFNYTQSIAQNRLLEAASSGGALTPFQDGAGWEGTWTLPVCDMGTNDWNGQFGDSGVFPCCCGANCTDTAAFVKAANMHGFQTLLRGCKNQLDKSKGNGTLDFGDVDYGFGWQHSFPLVWAALPRAQKAGVAIGFIIGVPIVVSLLVCWCVGIASICCG